MSERIQHPLVSALLDARAGIEARTTLLGGWTPLFFAANGGNIVALQTVVNRGADVHVTCAVGSTPLMQSVNSSNPIEVICQIQSDLIDAGVNVNVQSLIGKTVLDETMLTVYGRRFQESSDLLRSRGALTRAELCSAEEDIPKPDSIQQALDQGKAVLGDAVQRSKRHLAVYGDLPEMVSHMQCFAGAKARVIIPGGHSILMGIHHLRTEALEAWK